MLYALMRFEGDNEVPMGLYESKGFAEFCFHSKSTDPEYRDHIIQVANHETGEIYLRWEPESRELYRAPGF